MFYTHSMQFIQILTNVIFFCKAVSPDGKMVQSREPKEWHGCRATKGVQGHGN